MNKHQTGDYVFKDNKLREIINVIHTTLGIVYDTKEIGSDEIELCFECELKTSNN